VIARRRRTGAGVGALLIVLAGLLSAGALAATPSWKFDTQTYDFGPRPVGGVPIEHAFFLTNTGETEITQILWGTRIFGSESELFKRTSNPICRTLMAGESCSMSVAFNPLSLGTKSGELLVKTSSGEPSEMAVELKGEGGSVYVAVEPEVLNLGSVEVGSTSASRAVTVVNQGDIEMTWKGAYLTDPFGIPIPSGPFQIVGETCGVGAPVEPGGYCTVSVELQPSQAGAFSGELQLVDSGPGSPQSVVLKGTGTARPDAASPLPATPKPKSTKLVCPKGKRRVLRRKKQVCVKKAQPGHRHQRQS
jgi:hypothetical protein